MDLRQRPALEQGRLGEHPAFLCSLCVSFSAVLALKHEQEQHGWASCRCRNPPPSVPSPALTLAASTHSLPAARCLGLCWESRGLSGWHGKRNHFPNFFPFLRNGPWQQGRACCWRAARSLLRGCCCQHKPKGGKKEQGKTSWHERVDRKSQDFWLKRH